MSHDERTMQNLERENLRLRKEIISLETEVRLARELIKQHEENQKALLSQIQMLNALQS